MTHKRPSRFTRQLGICALAAITLMTPSALAQRRQASNDKAFRTKVNESFGLRQSEIITLDLNAKRGEGLFTFAPIGGLPTFLNLQPHSVRSDNYKLLVQQRDGSLKEVKPGPVRTMRGNVIGMQDAVVAGSLLDDGLHATIRFKDGSSMWIEPIGDRVAGAGANQHVLYRNEDVIQDAKVCGANDAMRVAQAAPAKAANGGGGSASSTAAATALCTAELACDTDYEYFQQWGSGTEAQINKIIGLMNMQYQNDVGITHAIGTIIVRTKPGLPYTELDAVKLITQFRNEWELNQTKVVRDMAQLFTGKNVDGGTIGIAWIGAVCTSHGYSMVQSDFNGKGSLACQTDLSAHELGHNWGADHCGCSNRRNSYTMNPFITCANQFHPKRTIPEIIAFRDSRTCLTECGGGDDPPEPPDGCTTPFVAEHACGPSPKRNDCLIITIKITCDDGGLPLEGATVVVRLDGEDEDGISTGDVLTGSATTNSNGEVSFKLRCRQAASPTYTSTVTSIDGVSTTVGDDNVQIKGCVIG
ncbi:MAG: hypothetical protein IH891_03885 [Planctomycetes bacterium]|nr:hypothetical protein [Planctomycetota bacterium]